MMENEQFKKISDALKRRIGILKEQKDHCLKIIRVLVEAHESAFNRADNLEVERDNAIRAEDHWTAAWIDLHREYMQVVDELQDAEGDRDGLQEILVGVRYKGDHENPCYCVQDPVIRSGWHDPMCKRAKAALNCKPLK